ncbi:hypothetical protein E1193_02840 [Micromonospora sp. KC606]|uniref:hypothetical protein n=1 Tax=Micromonospora sp. KC606 TaxID=2530379 RepID=UPI0010468991|nr:hypothetical protein [Micromonospora sp. KC606]TDC85425.1 hypothetical protein E1193_02840 [Micromonospora sp. KC606]
MTDRTITAGDVLRLAREASPQFATPIRVRVIRVLDWPTYHGWRWIDAYELNRAGDATRRRTLYVRVEGVRRLTVPATRARRRPQHWAAVTA